MRWGISQRCPRLYCARVAICAHKVVVVLVIAPHSAPAPAPPRMGNPPPEPIVLRGHGADVQCLCFVTVDDSNLWAPIAGGLACDALFVLYQREASTCCAFSKSGASLFYL